jgi:hypothetical protein
MEVCIMMNIVELVTIEANKAIAESRLTAMEYARLVKKLRANEDNAISIIRDCRMELCKRYMATNPNERTVFEDMYCSQLVRMVEFLRDTVKEVEAAKETIIEEPAIEEEETITKSVEEPVVVESDEQARQEQIAFIRKHTEWAINEAIDWAEYLNIPLDEVQIELLREEGLALAERMINDEEYIDYSYGSLKDCIEQSITCIKAMIRDLADDEIDM